MRIWRAREIRFRLAKTRRTLVSPLSIRAIAQFDVAVAQRQLTLGLRIRRIHLQRMSQAKARFRPIEIAQPPIRAVPETLENIVGARHQIRMQRSFERMHRRVLAEKTKLLL